MLSTYVHNPKDFYLTILKFLTYWTSCNIYLQNSNLSSLFYSCANKHCYRKWHNFTHSCLFKVMKLMIFNNKCALRMSTNITVVLVWVLYHFFLCAFQKKKKSISPSILPYLLITELPLNFSVKSKVIKYDCLWILFSSLQTPIIYPHDLLPLFLWYQTIIVSSYTCLSPTPVSVFIMNNINTDNN